ncbi:hypothetical protein QF001_000964 [Paraburkholderia youngii]
MGLFNDSTTDRHCKMCEHWGGDIAGGEHVLCVRDREQVQAQPERGCVFWVRCIGSDDEPAQAMLGSNRRRP